MSSASPTLTLHQASTSPFARKVRVVAIELGLADRIALNDVHVTPGKENQDYARDVNPLRKVPALTLADGTTLIDSTLICLYLDELAHEEPGSVQALVPGSGAPRWQVLNAHAVANGMTEAAVQLRYETFLRPEPQRWALWSDDLLDRINTGLQWFEARAGDGSTAPAMDLGTLALGCLLGYLDFRTPELGWRDRCPRLTEDYQHLAARYSFTSTEPPA